MVLNYLLILISTFNFADSLLIKKNYSQAIIEYKRELFYNKDDSLPVFKKLADAYFLKKDYIKASLYYSKIYSITDDDYAIRNLYKTVYLNRQYSLLNSILENTIIKSDSMILALSLARSGEYNKSSIILNKLKARYKFANPYFNKNISYLIPGSGQIAAGHWKDGIVAMTINGLFLYYSYYLIKNRNISSFIFILPVFFKYYKGNVSAAWKFTIENNNKLIDKIENEFNIR